MKAARLRPYLKRFVSKVHPDVVAADYRAQNQESLALLLAAFDGSQPTKRFVLKFSFKSSSSGAYETHACSFLPTESVVDKSSVLFVKAGVDVPFELRFVEKKRKSSGVPVRKRPPPKRDREFLLNEYMWDVDLDDKDSEIASHRLRVTLEQISELSDRTERIPATFFLADDKLPRRLNRAPLLANLKLIYDPKCSRHHMKNENEMVVVSLDDAARDFVWKELRSIERMSRTRERRSKR